MSTDVDPLLRLRQVLEIVPVSATTWWEGVKTGRFPPGAKLGPSLRVWPASVIRDLVRQISDSPSDCTRGEQLTQARLRKKSSTTARPAA
jgi:prophage regulatory protein